MKDYKKEFEEWRQRENVPVVPTLAEVTPAQEGDFKAGDMVMYTNEYGVTFGPVEVLGFRATPWNGRCVYLNKDAYWFPDRVSEIKHA